MKILLTALAGILLTACGGGESSPSDKPEPPPVQQQPKVTEYAVQSTWWELSQYFEGVPKYSGSFGTYTAKHTPSAVSCGLGDWAVYSENKSGVVEVYALNLDTGDSHLVHRNRVDDAHQNGSIQCAGDKLAIAVAGLGRNELGGMYESTDGEHWTRLTEDYKAYYQLHGTETYFYTLYEPNGGVGNHSSRYIYSSCNDERINDDGSTGSYMLSHYDGERYHVVYNKHPEGVVDKRYGLFYRSSVDGCEWSDESTWYNELDKLVYLKDLNSVNGRITALFTVSNSADPTQGERHVYTATAQGYQREFETNHNYTAGVLLSSGDIHFPNADIHQYAGGSFLDMSYVNYIKRVHGRDDRLIMSAGVSPKFKSDSWIVGATL